MGRRALKRNNLTLFMFVVIGLLAGTIIGELLSGVSWLSFLTTSAQITWEPKADFQAIKYDLFLQFRLNLISLIGVIAAVWLYRKF